jgi:thiamine pyrophosphokinase
VIEDFETKGTKVFRHKQDKDQTDTQLAVEYAIEKGASEVILLGCLGSRIDHTYANISLLIWLMQKGTNGVAIDECNEIRVIDKYIKISGKAGDLISLLAITPRVSGVSTKGLKYGLKDGELRYDNTLGISNEFLAEYAEIWVKEGTLMVIKAKD